MTNREGAALLIVLALAGCGGTTSGGPGDRRGVPQPPGPSGTGATTGAARGSGGSSGSVTGIGGASAPRAGTGGWGAGGAGGAGGTGAPNQGDKFVDVGTNPFVVTLHDPFSTFGADVDTASYDIFRRDVNLGLVPQPASVRLEEYVNYFDYDYAAPALDDAHPFGISLQAAGAIFDRQTTLLRVGIQAKNPPPFQKRPANLVFLVDVSGSMYSADKLPLVQRMLAATLEILDPQDTVAIVTYSTQVKVALPPMPVAESPAILTAIYGLAASGSTAGADGLGLAYAQARRGYIEGGINHIILCTDGDFNIGPSTTEELLAIVRRERLSGVTMTALGFGIGNLNDQMIEAIADAGNGMYSMISSAEHADRYVRERMLSTLVHVAQDVKIQVEFNPAQVAAYRLLGYENRAIADSQFRNDAVDAGEVGAGHRVTALYEIIPAGRAVPLVAGAPPIVDGTASDLLPEIGAGELVRVKVRYKAPGSSAETPATEVQAGLEAVHLRADLASCDQDLRWAAAVAALAEILKGSPYADRSFLPQIAGIIAEQAGRDADRAEMAALFAKIKSRL